MCWLIMHQFRLPVEANTYVVQVNTIVIAVVDVILIFKQERVLNAKIDVGFLQHIELQASFHTGGASIRNTLAVDSTKINAQIGTVVAIEKVIIKDDP
jgi:hypothetical protein